MSLFGKTLLGPTEQLPMFVHFMILIIKQTLVMSVDRFKHVQRGSNQTLRTKSSSVQRCYFVINPYERTRGLWTSWRWWRKTKRSEEKRLCASKQNFSPSIISVVRFRQRKTQIKSWVGFSICRFIHIINSLIYPHNTSLLGMWPLFLGRCEGAQVTGITSVHRDIRFQVNPQFLWTSDFTTWQLLI